MDMPDIEANVHSRVVYCGDDVGKQLGITFKMILKVQVKGRGLVAQETSPEPGASLQPVLRKTCPWSIPMMKYHVVDSQSPGDLHGSVESLSRNLSDQRVKAPRT